MSFSRLSDRSHFLRTAGVKVADAVVFDVVALAHGKGVLAGLALTLTDKKTAMRAACQEDLFCLASLDDAVEPVLGLDTLRVREEGGEGG
jgi:hypothetical protein